MQRMQIDPRHWADLNRLLDTALDLPLAERDRWLATLDPQYEGLKPQLRDLLSRAARIETRDFLNTLPKLDDASPGDVAAEEAGSSVGPYRLVRELGAGGMGSVWLAERTDGLIKRPVALKLPHIASRRIGLAERMAREREILATLTHPNIARLYDAGVTAEGRPYLALEYVEGKPIDVYCNERHLDVRARLRLFLQVTNAVAYAHAKLIIHRDLKPANILVTDAGEVRLLDFGVAKLLDAGQAMATQLTELSGRALTPDYASPEQILGEPLTIATDVYSLGVILYELLAGTKPHRAKRATRGAVEDAILHTDPAKPSDAAEPRWRRHLRGDLDTVVLKALGKRLADRYATANALAEDVERYLTRRPVLARPSSRWRHFAKFVLRNRLAVGAAGLAFIAVLTAALLAMWQARVALAEQARAEEVREFILAIFKGANPYSGDGEPLTATELLQQAAVSIDGIDASRVDLRVELLNLVGSSLLGLQDTDKAEQVLVRALAEGRKALPAHHPQVLQSRSLLITVHRFRGRTAEMEKELDALLPLLRSRDADPDALINALRDAAHLKIDSGRYEEAVTFAREAADLSLAKLGQEHIDTAAAWQVLGLSLHYAKRRAEALDATERAHALTLRVRGGNERHPQVINSRSSYGRALAESGRLMEGVAQIERAIADSAEVFGPDNRMVGFFSQNLIRYQLDLGKVEAAVAAAERAARILAQHVQPESFTYGAAISTRGAAYLAARRSALALSDLDAAYRTSAKVLGEKHDITARMAAMNAAAHALEGRAGEARELLVAASRAGGERADHGSVAYWSGFTSRLLGDAENAVRLQQIAYEASDDSARGMRQRMEALAELGLAYQSLSAHDRATASQQEALDMFASHHVAMSPARADVLVGLGRLRMTARDFAAALKPLSEADEFWRTFAPENRFAGEAALWLGRCYLALGRRSEAGETLRRAVEILERSPTPSDAQLVRLARRSAEVTSQ